MRMSEPVGEDAWLALVDEASRSASDLEQRVEVVELYKKAISAEPWSNKIWLAYCEWVWSLHTDCQTADAGWPEEEQQLGQELFSLGTALDVWQQGAAAIQYRLNDSHELWNRWISIELEELSQSPTRTGVDRVRNMFLERLQIPHASWNDTSQLFSTFITKYDEASWEATMVQTTQLAKHAKELYGQREEYELKLQQALDSGDKKAQECVMREYLEWESLQPIKKTKKGTPSSPPILVVALYERALSSTALGLDPSIWEDYIVFLSTSYAVNPQANLGSVLSVSQRSAAHCPWCGALWARYILNAETEKLDFSAIEQIKHAATSAGVLDRDGMTGVIEVYIAWCGYLRRRTLAKGAEDEAFDMADVGFPAALESVQDWGERLYGKKNYPGDSLFRIERIYIQYLTQKGQVEEARGWWKRLAKTHSTGYEFWEQYYLWEMTVRAPNSPPSLATAVLIQAVRTRQLDWPEKMIGIYIRHCHNYEDAETLMTARDTVHRQSKGVAKRREKEAAEQAALYAQQQPEASTADSALGESPNGTSKRKRESTSEEVDGSSNKKLKGESEAPDDEALREQHLKRDRENTTVIVTNLPAAVTQTKLRQYFKEYGHINSITMKTEPDGLSTTALIEFRSNEDVQSAFLRDGKYFGDKQIHVEAGTGLTLYVTNYNPQADESYMHKLFKDCGEIFSIRWPSLKYNTQRRFCYITFRTLEAAASATKLDGKTLENFYKLVAKYSDPSGKKPRSGATAEGRELHITSIDSSLSEEDIKSVFQKYGTVEAVRILRTVSGESKGAGFVVFEKKDDANAALALDKTKLKSSVLNVELTSVKNFKPTATSRGTKGTSASPGPDGESIMSLSPAPEAHSHTNAHALAGPSRDEVASRTITLLDVPDTVNDSRIRALAEPYGNIVKVVLRPDHSGAIIEYTEASAAGTAALRLEGHEINPGRKLRTGGLKDLFSQKDEIKSDRIQIGQGNKKATAANFIQPSAPIRRPGGGRGGRGGLGVKRGLGYSGTKLVASNTADAKSEPSGTENKPLKSNDDFRKLMNAGKQ